MKPATVTILTRTKNRPAFLARMVASVLQQSREDWHLVLIDAGEASPTRKLIESNAEALRGRVTHLPVDAHLNIGAMSNRGLDLAKTRFVTHLDDDDTWDTQFLEKMLGVMETNQDENVAGAVCQTMCVEEEPDGLRGYRTVRDYLHNPEMQSVHLGTVAMVNQFCVHAFLYETRVIAEIGGYDEALPVLDDWEFNLRFLRRFDIRFLPEPLANYHQRPGLTSGVDSNSLFARVQLHNHVEAKIINRAIRADLAGEGHGLGLLLANAAAQRATQERMKKIESRLAVIGDKIGKVDSRTKQLKDRLV